MIWIPRVCGVKTCIKFLHFYHPTDFRNYSRLKFVKMIENFFRLLLTD